MKVKNKQKEVKMNKGITLIALVITIIVLLILAAVSIATLTGNNGILNRATDASKKTNEAKDEELRQMAIAEAAMNFEDTEYNGVNIPAGYAPTRIDGENSIDEGLVIVDSKGNEYVWIEVPESIYTNAANDTDYANIESDMRKYAQKYNSNYLDVWASENLQGLTSKEYEDLKESMLKSVYDNNGFFIGRYEAGTEIPRSSYDDELVTPVIIKKDAYPYNFISCKQAQKKSRELSTSEKTTSLMFGIQWDLVCKFMEEKGYLNDGTKVTESLLKESKTWGNYLDIGFKVERGKYSTTPSDSSLWEDVNNYEKPEASSVLLTTGATNRNKVLSIYDFAGNIEEYTLGKSKREESPICGRGRNFKGNGTGYRS